MDNNQEDTSRDHAGSQYNKKQPDLSNNGLGAVVFIFIVMFSLLFMQDSDFVWKTFLLLGFIRDIQ